MEFQDWLEEQMQYDVLSTLLLDFLMAYPLVYNMFKDEEEVWVAISVVLDLLPDDRQMEQEAFKLYCTVLEAMLCFKKYPVACDYLIIFLRENLDIKKGAKNFITKEDILDLKIDIETSSGVRDFIKKM